MRSRLSKYRPRLTSLLLLVSAGALASTLGSERAAAILDSDGGAQTPPAWVASTAGTASDPQPTAAPPKLRLAQGSAGGTLGKKDQSLSGGQQSKEPPTQRERKQPSYSLSGTWEYTQDCQVGTYRGTMQISQTGAGSFRGTAHQESPKISAPMVNGTISGNRVSFNATFSSLETWRGTLSSSGRMQGTVTTSSVGNCTWHASRN